MSSACKNYIDVLQQHPINKYLGFLLMHPMAAGGKTKAATICEFCMEYLLSKALPLEPNQAVYVPVAQLVRARTQSPTDTGSIPVRSTHTGYLL